MGLKENLDSRQRLLMALRAEVLGPDPVGERREIPSTLTLEESRAWGPASQLNGEEILTLDTPIRRYGAGILHPEETQDDLFEVTSGGAVAEEVDSGAPVREPKKIIKADTSGRSFKDEGDDFGIAAANGFKPSAMGISFVVDVDALRGDVVVTLANRVRHTRLGFTTGNCGYYKPHNIQISNEGESTARPWWLRCPLVIDNGDGQPNIRLTADGLRKGLQSPIDIQGTGFPGKLQVQVNVRGWPGAPSGQRLVTVSLRNRRSEAAAGGVDAVCLFQSGLLVSVPDDAIRAYPEAQIPLADDGTAVDDHRINRLIYRNRKVHAVGHGCSADWNGDAAHIPGEIWTDFMPVYEMAPMAFDVLRGDQSKLKLSMRELGDAAKAESLSTLGELVELYENWISEREAEARTTKAENTELGRTADEMINRCRQALVRMRTGVDVLASDEHAMSAFQLTNQAMLMAQHRRPKDARKPDLDRTGVASWPKAYVPLDMASPQTIATENIDLDRPVGLWRPFQLAFLLMSLDGIVNDEASVDREIVDLIWFPTGGGKTEAYLGLTAFTVLYNALTRRSATQVEQHRAVSVLMRYTLRLLTAQQFQRAVTLFCALELLRSADEVRLGNQRFTVGLWVGGSSTPNKSDDAGRALKLMDGSVRARPDEDADQNPFVLLQCPWCSSAFGRQGRKPNSYESIVHGYQVADKQAQKFRFACPDPACEFGLGKNVQIPALVVDEDIYRVPPTLLIGTVDKFAMLAWKPEIRSLFGINQDGERQRRAPDLIIQDELHLMTGPLGTMVGLFEVVVEAMCRHDGGTSPKVIASTATAARAAEQVLGLYARKDTSVFPPTGLDASDSFFAKEDTESPGRLYVGVLAPGHGSMQTTQARTYSALMQAVANIAADAEQDLSASLVDPWWSLLAYYNSLRELGGALTLFGADIPEYLRAMHRRNGTPASARRWIQPDRVMELTSRLRSDEVPEALRSMERELTSFRNAKDGSRALYPPYDVIDACLASNIVEVGVDVPRLSLMALVGQPKTTSSYIQASSRVGRRDDRPGLIVMLYSTTKPRDRSHYEKFRSYHQAIYAWVEPTSVTPYSPPALERALHAVLVAMTRQMSSSSVSPPNVISNSGFIDEMESILVERAAIVARADEVEGAAQILQSRLRQWRTFDPQQWGNIFRPDPAQPGLLYPSGKQKPQEWGHIGWSTPTSLRDVDASCEAEVTQYYAELSSRVEP